MPRMSASSKQHEAQSRPRQHLHPFFTTWHITFGAHAARLHGGPRATVDRQHNQRGEPFIDRNPDRESRERAKLKAPPVMLSVEQCAFIESLLPVICTRGSWILRIGSASPPPFDGDHVHVLLDAPPQAQPKVIRELLKRWLTQALNERRPPVEQSESQRTSEPARPRADTPPRPGAVTSPRPRGSEPARPRAAAPFEWWAEGGSTKPVKDESYLNNAYTYVEGQRATPRAVL
jgi:hypothetical protein